MFLSYPCRCLCFGFSQMTRTTFFRRTTLHLGQIRLTDERTFMATPFLERRAAPWQAPFEGAYFRR